MLNNYQVLDFGTLEMQKQWGGGTKGYTASNKNVARVNHQSPLDVLYHRGLLDDKQWKAGEMLRRDAYLAGKFAYVRSSADFSVRGNITDRAAEFIAKASRRYNERIRSLNEYEKAVVLLIVIQEGAIRYITDYKLRLAAMDILRSGLDVLVKEYGVK